MTTLDGAHVLVTGGSSGIGFEVARRALTRGAHVSIIARDPARLATAADVLEQEVGDATRVAAEPADVTDPEQLGRALPLLTAQLGPVDVMVANAGAAIPGHFEDLPLDVFRAQMELNYFGVLHSVRAVLPSMIERRSGHLVLVSSAAGVVGVYGYSAYAPTKFAVRGLAETLRAELRPFGILAACALPPDTDTPGLASESTTKPEATKSFSESIKVRSPEAVGAAIVRGIERDRLVITADPSTRLLARASGLLGPAVRWSMDRHVRRAEPGRAKQSPEGPRE